MGSLCGLALAKKSGLGGGGGAGGEGEILEGRRGLQDFRFWGLGV